MRVFQICFFCLLFIAISTLDAFVLKNHWLDASEVYNPYNLFYDDWMNDAMLDSLTTDPILFNLGSCLAEMQPESVTQQPVVNNGGLNSVGNPLLRYSGWFIYNEIPYELRARDYAVSTPPENSTPEEIHSFEITINDSTQYPWNISGGGPTGGVDINTIFRHEAGHIFGIAHSISTEITLMSDGDKYASENYPSKTIGTEEINALKVIFDEPTSTLRNNVVIIGDSIVSDINFPVPDFLTYPELSFHCYIYKDNDIQNTIPFEPNFLEYLPNDYSHYSLEISTSDMALGIYSIRTYSAMEWNPTGDIALYETHNRPYSEVSFKVVAAPQIESPLPGEQYYTRPSGGKDSITDTLAIKVRVPEVLGSYPAINIKIDDVYVNQGDINFDSGENVWVYNWDLSAVSTTEYGKWFAIKAEIDGDPTDYDVTGIYLVEALLFEDFENFTFGEWTEEGEENPANSYEPWEIWANPTNSNEKSVRSTTGYTTSQSYRLLSPSITIPDSSENKTKFEFDIYWDYAGSLWSNLFLEICDTNGNPIGNRVLLPKFTRSWWRCTYDLSKYSGQTIKIRWDNYHNFNPSSVLFTLYCLDDIVVYAIPDMDSPNIDFVSGNFADLNEDMNINLEFNDLSAVGDVTADYEIEGDTDTITLMPVKNTYNYTGTIPARDHECIGSISFKIKDSVGNETVSSGHSIGWAIGGGGLLTAPQNVLMTVVNDSTFTITWDIVDGATGYKIYTSLDPYGSFTEDTTGTFTESRKWQKTFDGNKYFYYVVATNAAKKEEFEIKAKNNSDR